MHGNLEALVQLAIDEQTQAQSEEATTGRSGVVEHSYTLETTQCDRTWRDAAGTKAESSSSC